MGKHLPHPVLPVLRAVVSHIHAPKPGEQLAAFGGVQVVVIGERMQIMARIHFLQSRWGDLTHAPM